MTAAERFETRRAALLRHAYRMLGDYGEAEDAVQEAYLRFDAALARAPVADDAAFLRATVTRLALDRLRSARARRERYVGPWLPEPIVAPAAGDPADAAALADDVSFALLLALERLTPLERAAFLLHDALDVPFAEIATTLGRSEEAVRRLASRARARLRELGPRTVVPRERAEAVRDALLGALVAGDLTAVQRVLAEDVVFLSDGGGQVTAALNPVVGRDRVGRLLVGLATKGLARVTARVPATLNGLAGYAFYAGGVLDQTVALESDGEHITAIYVTRNPEKLAAVRDALASRRT